MLKLLFTPIKVGSLELKNRIVMPAMHYLASWEGMVLPHHVDYFGRTGQGGAALIIIGGCTSMRPAGRSNMLSAKDDSSSRLAAWPRRSRSRRENRRPALPRGALRPTPCSWGEKQSVSSSPSAPDSPARPPGSFRSGDQAGPKEIMPWPRRGFSGPGSMPSR